MFISHSRFFFFLQRRKNAVFFSYNLANICTYKKSRDDKRKGALSIKKMDCTGNETDLYTRACFSEFRCFQVDRSIMDHFRWETQKLRMVRGVTFRLLRHTLKIPFNTRLFRSKRCVRHCGIFFSSYSFSKCNTPTWLCVLRASISIYLRANFGRTPGYYVNVASLPLFRPFRL